ncbi:hypothetical protein VTO42DRAFT_4112 [Malbranchea cinnamomea]
MLVTPRTYRLSQTPDKGLSLARQHHPVFRSLRGWTVVPAEHRRAVEMLLIHQVGSVHVGEVVRYTLTYTPSADRILPPPSELYVKIKNTSAIPLRAAYLRGPYTIHVSCYPSWFDPNRKSQNPEVEGAPQFEPNLKAGGAWDAVIPVPERVRDASWASLRHPSTKEPPQPSVSWIIEISSQIIFSTSAAVHFEVLVGRDEKSTELGASGLADFPPPGKLEEHSKRIKEHGHKNSSTQVPGVYSDSIQLRVDDTSSLWNSPRFPSWDEKDGIRALEEQHSATASGKNSEPQQGACSMDATTSTGEGESRPKKRKKVHFVVLTHGLHSNLGADMLYLKETIDAAAKKAREDAKQARDQRVKKNHATQTDGRPSKQGSEDSDESEDDDEMVIVRGFPGNVVRTERGIQYLGKRLAKYVLLVTYPDQPYLPIKKPRARTLSEAFGFGKGASTAHASHHGSTIHRQEPKHTNYAYKITSISFIGHSLGGLVQTYAIAYIQKHSPEFFDLIKPVNFIALATPFLGLSNENPLYVKFALDFGLVGRTGQDLGLTWSAPAKVRSGWGAMIGGLGNENQKKTQGDSDPRSKPLLRVLPTGPAHQVLKKFRNRTVYSNVVNDGIVPLRTSCLLFLDWRGLDRVEKARRENGLVGTMAEWTWAELTGANSRSPRSAVDSAKVDTRAESGREVPQPSGIRSPTESSSSLMPSWTQYLRISSNTENLVTPKSPSPPGSSPSTPMTSSPLNGLFSLFKPQAKPKDSKSTKIIRRSQTLSGEDVSESQADGTQSSPTPSGRTRGDSLYEEEGLNAPPKTTIFESAGDLLNPPLPPLEYILDPSTRPRTIFHDRVYHPGDIPPPPPGRQRTLFSTPNSNPGSTDTLTTGNSGKPRSMSSGMKVEEKIARAYHRDLSWRKVLVSLEPDAHNNIIVRRKFANAYGWPVVKHLVDTHFAYTAVAQTPDAVEEGTERAAPVDPAAAACGNEVLGQEDRPGIKDRRRDESQSDNAQAPASNDAAPPTSPRSDPCDENKDTVPEMTFSPVSISRLSLSSPNLGSAHGNGNGEDLHRPTSSMSRASSMQDSARWTDRYFEEEDDDEDDGIPFDSSDRRAETRGLGLQFKVDTTTASTNALGGPWTNSPFPKVEAQSGAGDSTLDPADSSSTPRIG